MIVSLQWTPFAYCLCSSSPDHRSNIHDIHEQRLNAYDSKGSVANLWTDGNFPNDLRVSIIGVQISQSGNTFCDQQHNYHSNEMFWIVMTRESRPSEMT